MQTGADKLFVGGEDRQISQPFAAGRFCNAKINHLRRQALALMDHPNIAKVFDAGATETGRPYFVMELVKGIPITRYCDENNLSTAARLALFVQVCQPSILQPDGIIANNTSILLSAISDRFSSLNS